MRAECLNQFKSHVLLDLIPKFVFFHFIPAVCQPTLRIILFDLKDTSAAAHSELGIHEF